ncbi:hypothetical protein [Micromonospora sp. NPDC005324]|uniref:hypothetical protein n=1 Tax=Micromonospora sp. NPDC005324 TaxID=3157033 RepID=UPI0033A1F11D
MSLPIKAGPARCPDCWTPPGQEHELSCPAVSPAQFRAFLAERRAHHEEQARRELQRELRWRSARWWIAGTVLLVVALVWGPLVVALLRGWVR